MNVILNKKENETTTKLKKMKVSKSHQKVLKQPQDSQTTKIKVQIVGCPMRGMGNPLT